MAIDWVWKSWVKQPLVVVLMGVAVIATSERAIAHGTAIRYRGVSAIEVQANYDSGDPLANAQVTVFAPDNPSEPWLTGTTDDQGRFIFTPDEAIAGDWDVQVRQAGHGDIVSIPLDSVDSELSTFSSEWLGTSSGVSPAQKIVMIASIMWGLLGTALFFSARIKKHAHS
ncbi:MAG: carboxypeptidase-like regulatory domain-containing protein [Cyanobacteria bacterium J06627_8]